MRSAAAFRKTHAQNIGPSGASRKTEAASSAATLEPHHLRVRPTGHAGRRLLLALVEEEPGSTTSHAFTSRGLVLLAGHAGG